MKLVNVETIKGHYEGMDLDFDRYNIDVRTPLATKEYSVIVDFKEKEIVGEVLAYGGMGDIEPEEAIELLEKVLKEHTPKRSPEVILELCKK